MMCIGMSESLELMIGGRKIIIQNECLIFMLSLNEW